MMKSIILGCLSFFLMTLANADWQCRVHNGGGGQSWYGHAAGRAEAVSSAMHFCVHNSVSANQCVIDYCQAYGRGKFVSGGSWQCSAENSRGQVWVGMGPTRARAAAHASGQCIAHTQFARNCIVKGCSVR